MHYKKVYFLKLSSVQELFLNIDVPIIFVPLKLLYHHPIIASVELPKYLPEKLWTSWQICGEQVPTANFGLYVTHSKWRLLKKTRIQKCHGARKTRLKMTSLFASLLGQHIAWFCQQKSAIKKTFAKTFWKRLIYFRWKYFKIYRIENFLKQLTSNQYYGQNKTLHYKSEHLF